MKRYDINGNTCYTISGQLAIDTEGDPIFAACEDVDYILGMDEGEAVALIEACGEAVEIDDVNSIGIQNWATEWAA